jgi:hypothetical protein
VSPIERTATSAFSPGPVGSTSDSAPRLKVMSAGMVVVYLTSGTAWNQEAGFPSWPGTPGWYPIPSSCVAR